MAKSKVGPRENVLSWDEYFMSVAHLVAMRSKDPSTQVGACIVDARNVIVSTGYNGWPRGIANDALPWDRDNEDPLENKYIYVVHAEKNAILNADRRLDGCRIYVSLIPCNECAKAIIQSGIKEVVYISDKYAHVPEFIAGKRLLKEAGIKLRQFIPPMDKVVITFPDRPKDTGTHSR